MGLILSMDTLRRRREAILLLVGDTIFFYVSLWVTLILRYGRMPSPQTLADYVAPFSLLVLVWLLSFFIAGLYDRHTLLFQTRLPKILLRAQITNIILAAAFFYLIPFFAITPKTNLFIYLFVSSVFILAWRLYGGAIVDTRKRQNALLIGSSAEMHELAHEVNHNDRYALNFVSVIDLDKKDSFDAYRDVLDQVFAKGVSIIVLGGEHQKVVPLLPYLYNLLFSGVRFVELNRSYEAIFDRIPLSILGYKWFLENVDPNSHMLYDILKRAMDIVLSFALGIVSLALYPLVYAAIKLDDRGAVFLRQERVGQHGRTITILKFRTMNGSDKGKWVVDHDPRITRAGEFLRKTRIDELPQLWNVLKGDLSLIGPRPELPELAGLYEKEIPYYNARHLLKPGLSGWGQIHHEKPPHSIEATKEKLSYDLYYLKNRSILLDLEIALKTVRTLLSRSGV